MLSEKETKGGSDTQGQSSHTVGRREEAEARGERHLEEEEVGHRVSVAGVQARSGFGNVDG